MVIKYFNWIPVALLFCLSLNSCEEERAHPRDYPRVRTLPVSNITGEGATFKADLYSLGTENIKEYGFVWGPNIDPGLESDKVVFPGANATIGVYTSEIRSTLTEGTEYTVKSYVKTDTRIVYGTPLTFISLGSLAPVITAFSPDTVVWGDTLKIRGKNFSWIASKNIVRLNQTECHVIASSDTMLLAIVKGTLSDAKVKISVELTGNSALFDKKDLFIKIPVITGFFPPKAKWQDTLTITGKNLIAGFNEYSAKIGDLKCDVYLRKKDTLTVIVSSELVNASNEVKITINASEITVPDPFTLVLPEITGLSPQGARWGDTIIISGTDLMTSRNRFTVTIGELSGVFIKYRENAIKVVVPLNLEQIANEVKIRINNLELEAQKPLELLPPEISGISPEEGTWHDILTIRGHFHPLLERNMIIIGGSDAELISKTRDSIKVKVPSSLAFHNNAVGIAAGPFNVTSQYSFKLHPPYLKSVSPLTGYTFSTVTIMGKYFFKDYTYYNHVYFGTQEAWIESANDSVIVCKVPSGLVNGPVKITVQVREQSTIFKDNFISVAPVITRIYPLNGFYGDAITIEGMNFSLAGSQIIVTFNDYGLYWKSKEAQITSMSDTRIIARVPEGLDSIPKRIMVYVGDSGVESEQLFILDPPQINFVSPLSMTSGQLLTITGKNFNPSADDNKVFWGTHQIPVKSSTRTEIIATVPLGMSRGINKISIITAGYKRSYPVDYQVKSKWAAINAEPLINFFQGPDRGSAGVSFVIGNTGYIIDSGNGRMFYFDPVTGTFNGLGYHQNVSWSGLSGTVNKDTLYLVEGENGLWKYDKTSNVWSRISDAPSAQLFGVTFSLGGKIYHGLNFDDWFQLPVNKLWVFNHKLKMWESKTDFPDYSDEFVSTYFTFNNKAYFLFADKVFCEYDPASDKWTKLSSFPGPGNIRVGMVSFVINDKAYVGLGKDYFAYEWHQYDDFWTFNPQTGSWSESTFMPWGPRYNSISFVVNNKAYVGFGYKLFTQQNDFFEFDPEYPVK